MRPGAPASAAGRSTRLTWSNEHASRATAASPSPPAPRLSWFLVGLLLVFSWFLGASLLLVFSRFLGASLLLVFSRFLGASLLLGTTLLLILSGLLGRDF